MARPRVKAVTASSRRSCFRATTPSFRCWRAAASESGATDGGRAQQVLDAAQQLGGLEGLLEVVVGAVLLLDVRGEAPPDVDRGDHDHGDVAETLARLELAADLEAVDLGEHPVEDDQVRHRLADLGQRLAARPRREDPVSLLLEDLLHEPEDRVVVVHRQDGLDLLDGGDPVGGRGCLGHDRGSGEGLEDGAFLLLERREGGRRGGVGRGGVARAGSRGARRGLRVADSLHVGRDLLLPPLESPPRLDDGVLDARLEGDHRGQADARLELDLGHEDVVHRIRHGDLQARPLDANGEDEVSLAELQRKNLEDREVDLGLGQVHRRDAELAAQVRDGELLGQDLLPHQDAGQALPERPLKSQGFGELAVVDEVGLAEDLPQFLPRHRVSLPRRGRGSRAAALRATP